MSDEPAVGALEDLEVAAAMMIRTPVPDGGAGADVLGRVRKIEVDLAAYRTGALSEMDEFDVGEAYRVEVTRGRSYEYNWAKILLDMATVANSSLWDALTKLRTHYGVKLTGTKANIEKALRHAEIDFVTGRADGYDDVPDLDRPHVLWSHKKPRTSIEPIPRDQ